MYDAPSGPILSQMVFAEISIWAGFLFGLAYYVQHAGRRPTKRSCYMISCVRVLSGTVSKPELVEKSVFEGLPRISCVQNVVFGTMQTLAVRGAAVR